jgi:predicted ATPase
MVGRQAELDQLNGWLAGALNGERQVVFVTGEAGIGKTTVLAALVAHLAGEESLWVGRGQCIEQYGAGEAYLPVLEALGRLSRTPQGERLVALLRQHAPTWLIQMPALLDAAEREALQRAVTGTTQSRMLREMAEALEAITAEMPLVLILEDLQWADYSTVELLAALARRREAARLLVLATYRPVDVLVGQHPLHRVKQELQLHGQCQELALALLQQTAVDDYLAERFANGVGSAPSLPGLASLIHRWTEGNPLFMVTLVDELVKQGILVVPIALTSASQSCKMLLLERQHLTLVEDTMWRVSLCVVISISDTRIISRCGNPRLYGVAASVAANLTCLSIVVPARIIIFADLTVSFTPVSAGWGSS